MFWGNYFNAVVWYRFCILWRLKLSKLANVTCFVFLSTAYLPGYPTGYILLGKAGFLFLSLSLQGIPKGSANPTWLSPALALESPRAVGALSPLLSTPVLSATRTTFTQAHCLIMVREIRGTITAAGLEWNQLVKGGERGQNAFFLPFQRFTQKLYLKLFMTLRVQDT